MNPFEMPFPSLFASSFEPPVQSASDYSLYREDFGSIYSLLNTINNRENNSFMRNEDSSQERGNEEWSGTSSYEEAQSLLIHGYEDPVKNIKSSLAKNKKLRQAVEIFGKAAEKIPAITKYYATIQSEQDRLQEDLLHKFEFTSPGNIIFVKLGRMLKACRIKRREAKDRLGYMIAIGDAKGKNILAAHNNHNRLIETRNYNPRVAPELFN